ncbi:MAG: aminopeptidase, partial [Betaproteobacteria bacterium]|nr:aminopeptidase [Betaproteobacteria bacterium]
MSAPTPKTIYLKDYAPSAFLIPTIELDVAIFDDYTRVTSGLTLRRNPAAADRTAPLVLDGEELTLESVALDGRLLNADEYNLTAEHFTIPDVPDEFVLAMVCRIKPQDNTKLSGFYASKDGFVTQCEAEGFRRITFFIDRPDVMARFTTTLDADKARYPVLLANGNLVESADEPATQAGAPARHWAKWEDPFPKPSYLFAMVAAKLDVLEDTFVTRSGKNARLAIYIEPGKLDQAGFAMQALKKAMKWDEDVFGLELDLDQYMIVAVGDFNMGAMENKGLNIFNDKYVLADQETATDADFANIEAIIAHEYFHNWTGNRITCRDWFQLCLKEGLTVFRDHEFSADQRSRPVKRIAEVRLLRAHQFPEDQGPLAHPVRPRRYREINNFYTATVYEKGSEVVRMIRTILGPDAFRAGMDLYFERHDGDAATIEDFIKVFEDASGRDLSQFALWYHQAGTPNLTVSSTHNPAAQEFTLEIEQSVPPTPSESRKRLMHIPLAFGLIGAGGNPVEYSGVEGASVEDGVIHVRKRRHMVRFSGVAERPAVSLNRGFSAPVTLSVEQKADDQFFLARHDSDAFSRWQAFNTLLTDALIAAFREILGGKQPVFATRLVELAGSIAGDETLEPAYRALALALPGEADIARDIGKNIDPDAIYAARQALALAIGTANGEVFSGLYDRLADKTTFSPDAASAGRRALRNTLLDYLSLLPGGAALAAGHFQFATNMTDRAAALGALAHRHHGSPEAIKALAAFETTYGSDPLVMDKWFQIQASVPGPQSVDTVRALTSHPAFSMANPNRVR